jgi:D-serine deaminase-like pyridoxal phosphate-dependent protein
MPQSSIPRSQIDTPALLIDLEALDRNIARMAAFFQNLPCKLRPHVKTHKCPEIATRQLQAGAIGITCAKVGEAEVFVEAGIQDILIANQIVGPEKTRRLAALANKAKITVAVDHPRNVEELSSAAREASCQIGVLLEVDVGMGRCGVPPGEPALSLAKEVIGKEGLILRGLMSYEGHLVLRPDPEERRQAVLESMSLLLETVRLLEKNGLPVEVVSGGGTGTYDSTGTLPRMTEVQAGSYVFMDATYLRIRPEFEPALTLLTTVVSRPARDRAITDCGRKAITEDLGLPQPYQLPGVKVGRLAEEHCTLNLLEGAPDLQPGDKIQLLPSHCCTTVNLHDRYFALRSGVLEAVWPIPARGKFT